MVWVSGFSEETIERKWPSLKKTFRGFRANQILEKSQEDPGYFLRVSPVKNKRKIAAIVQTARMLKKHGLDYFIDPFPNLLLLPWVKATNRRFLLRNMGLADVAKDDIWLKRLAKDLGYGGGSAAVEEMVDTIHQKTRYKRGVIDVVLWRAMQKGWRN
jgi:3-methyladenine DNA glycosylase Tag